MSIQSKSKRTKAVGLISGGLDSILAAKIIKDLGIEVHGIHFSMPWEYNDQPIAEETARQIGIQYINIQLDDQYLQMVRNPKHGYGSAMNPCMDCHVYMIKRAAEYMNKIDAAFVFTGEVLGQRPMSQNRQSLNLVERKSELAGRLVRPLSARCLEPTLPEQEGILDREKLLNISGRSRQAQIQLAQDLKITQYKQPAGGCLLTDKNFSNRLQDMFDHGYRDFRDTILLQWGRHFRINDDFKVIVGRDEHENDSMMRHAHQDDYLMILEEEAKIGPTLLLTGCNPTQSVLSTAAGLIQRFSKYKNDAPLTVKYWPAKVPTHTKSVTAQKLNEDQIQKMSV